ncbi:MAG TPA: type ISP restriction/modification enzyme [Candidatus Acidoferrum sp.]|nr:type ISP restriction/modification enzyme [Candidatus Acidoferrum sp.]
MTESQFIAEYTEAIEQEFSTGLAREHAYRPALKQLMKSFEGVDAVNEPPRSAYGNPDFVFLKSSQKTIILGYAEAKDITVDLAKTVKTEQLRRYAGYENLYLTNCLDFKFFRNGEQYAEVSIGKLINGHIVFDQNAFARLWDELKAFLELPPESIKSGKRLAEIMGAKARRIRDNVSTYLTHKDNEQNIELEKMYAMIKTLLVHDLAAEKFADMYAQTLVYGLFVARYNDQTSDSFTRTKARDLVPASNPFLREFFDHIVGPRFDARLGYIVDELCEVFSVSDVQTIVHKHLKLTDPSSDDKDPIIHFYEDFLKEYDPVVRKEMGAYYTPIPVVRFIIRQVDEALRRDFGLAGGLADTTKRPIVIQRQGVKTRVDVHKVQILDPAVGTATFLNEIIKFIYQGFKGQEGRWPSYVEQDLLPRLYGFELMMAPYTIAHLKLGMTLQETGVQNFRQRLGVYLTNTLEEGSKDQIDLFTQFGLAEVVSQEANEAARIKHEKPIMVIVGNPPYSGVSSNETKYANSLINKYKVEPGGQVKLQERKHWLNDDYVKFIAFAEDMIAKNGEGIMAMITNHGYLDNPTFRGMRWHLAQTFDTMYILDLHGNTKKKETAPDGGPDKNVFDIQQGVAIIIAVKNSGKSKPKLAKVFHAELYGGRSNKFEQLISAEPHWQELTLDKRMYYFVNKNLAGQTEYQKGIKLSDLFIVYNTGIVTMGDSFIVAESPEVLRKRIEKLIAGGYTEDGLNREFGLGKNYAKWILSNKDKIEFDGDKIVPLAYRPFDARYTYFDNKLVWRPRSNVMHHLLDIENVGLVASRLNRQASLGYFFMAKDVSDFHILDSAADSTSIFPLYLYHDSGRTPNLKPEILKQLTKNLKNTYEPEDVLDYIYAALHSPSYRETYKEFLKTDFPRVPVPAGDAQFKRLANLGKQLREVHLMTSSDLNTLMTTYSVINGTNEIEKVEFVSHPGDPETGDVYINQTQYFGNVPKQAWTFYIGGYQPAQKYLKDRKGRVLTSEEIEHYQKIVKALAQTHKVMGNVDNSI